MVAQLEEWLSLTPEINGLIPNTRKKLLSGNGIAKTQNKGKDAGKCPTLSLVTHKNMAKNLSENKMFLKPFIITLNFPICRSKEAVSDKDFYVDLITHLELLSCLNLQTLNLHRT